MGINRDNVKCIHKEHSNQQLVEQLKKLKAYLLSEDVPEWQQLIATTGFVIDVVKLLKWSEYKTRINCSEISSMTCDDICDELMNAVGYHLESPFADKLNSMWQDWKFNDNGKYANINTMNEMSNIICDCLEMEYPNLLELLRKYFKINEVENEKFS